MNALVSPTTQKTVNTPPKTGRWTPELNFLAFRNGAELDEADLPAETRLRISIQWREPHDPEISVVTDLVDEVKYPAEALLSTYHSRWGIETVFQQITDVFSLKHLIGSQPQAVLFQLSFCLLLYNTLQVVRAHLASHQQCEVKTISNEKLFYDVKRQLVAVDELVDVDALLAWPKPWMLPPRLTI